MTLNDIILTLPALAILAYVIFFVITRRPLFKEYLKQKRAENTEFKKKAGNQ